MPFMNIDLQKKSFPNIIEEFNTIGFDWQTYLFDDKVNFNLVELLLIAG